jgi:hypothetical protein
MGSQKWGRVVAKAWTDPAFRARSLAKGKSAVGELGLTMPPHHRHLVALENTPSSTSEPVSVKMIAGISLLTLC